ncbi:hypothetical protein [Streptococcus sp. sy010]|uniref:hypothetical protein n=1 Tax=Streptococcus sp. sy010 TaxID=2600148 RepID=UPI0011B6818F|nr:hypothetical protein [Streptococcus sp. sy010]TWT16283.1 hypothetical protein FRX51_03080 [Streptococcus sp. sy010]
MTLKTSLIASSLLATAVLSSEQVKADTIQETPESSVKTVTPAEVVTAEQIEQARSDADNAAADVVLQESQTGYVYNNLQDAIVAEEVAQNTLTTAQTQAENATPEVITQVDTEIATAQTTVENLETAIDVAQNQVKENQTVYNDVTTDVNTAQVNYETAQLEVEAAATKIETLQSSNEDLTTIESQVQEAEKTVIEKTTAVMVAENKVVEAKESDSQLEQAITEAKSNVETSKEQEKQAESDVSVANQKMLATQKVVESKTAEVESVKPLVTYSFDVNLPQEVKDAARALYDDYSPETVENMRQVMKASGLKVNDVAQNKADWLKYNIEGGDDVIDVENLTDKQFEVINQYYVDAYNALADELGFPRTSLNSKLMEIAKIRADMYDQKDTYQSHDYNIIKASNRQVLGEKNQNIVGENLDQFALISEKQPTLKDLLSQTVIAVNSFTLFDQPGNYGHFDTLTHNSAIGIDIYKLNTKKVKIIPIMF